MTDLEFKAGVSETNPKQRNHIVYLSNEVPNKEYDTVLYTGFLMIKGLCDAGFDVTVALLRFDENSVATSVLRQRWMDELRELDVGIVTQPLSAFAEAPKRGRTRITRPLRKFLLPQIKDHFPLISNAPKVTEVVQSLKPDLVIYWGNFQTISACAGLKHLPFVAILGEPPHFPEWFRIRPPFRTWSYRFTPRFWRQSIILRINRRLSLRLLRKFQTVWCTVTYLTNWYQENGIRNCQHVRNVVPDWGGSDWRARLGTAPTRGKLKIVLMGNVGGTSTVAGLYFLAREILPHLDSLLDDQFEIHICGGGELPPELKQRFKRSDVILRGFVDDIISELRTSDVFLVPTPIPLGSRVRVAYAWSVGCSVISHAANIIGLEEMKDGHNALIGISGLEVAKAIMRIREEPGLAVQLQANGRETFERYYSEAATVDKIVLKVEKLVGRSKTASSYESQSA